MEQFKDAYEISLWGDVYKNAEGATPAHYEEEKIGVIGSDSMTAQWRAVEPKLTQNVNGTNTFTFKMFYTYIDTITGERKDNPFQNLLVNERKVKVKWKGKWYDFVIKSCQEDSSGKSVTYTCQDQFINELSKTGFNLEFDDELGNNMDTIQNLAKKVVSGTDWQISGNEKIKQEREEPVYDICYTWEDGQQERHIRFLVYYSVVQNHETYFQYWYDSEVTLESQKYPTEYGSMLVIDGNHSGAECKSVTASWDGETASFTINGKSLEVNFSSKKVSDEYRANRAVRTQETAYSKALNRYVSKYTYNNNPNNIAYGYETTVYNDVTDIKSYITTGSGFTTTKGWMTSDSRGIIFTLLGDEGDATSYLSIPGSESQHSQIYNSGIYDYRLQLQEGFIKDEKYIIRIKARQGVSPYNYINGSGGLTIKITPFIGKYDKESYEKIDNSYFDSLNENDATYKEDYTLTLDTERKAGKNYYIIQDNQYVLYTGVLSPDVDYYELSYWTEWVTTCNTTITYKDIISLENPVGFLLTDVHAPRYIENIQFFKYTENESGEILYPGSFDSNSVVKVEQRFFDEQYLDVLNADDIEYLAYSDSKNLPVGFDPVYPSGEASNEKVRSISIKNSNRFNLIQTLAETFECWAKFTINHEDNGELIYDDNGKPEKFISFTKEVGGETGVGFVYGIDLNTITRTINSDQISTKVIVSPNSNEFGEDGFCTISRASENYSKSNFILNFDYYIQKGMLDRGMVDNDLYNSVSAEIPYISRKSNWTPSGQETWYYVVVGQKQAASERRALHLAANTVYSFIIKVKDIAGANYQLGFRRSPSETGDSYAAIIQNVEGPYKTTDGYLLYKGNFNTAQNYSGHTGNDELYYALWVRAAQGVSIGVDDVISYSLVNATQGIGYYYFLRQYNTLYDEAAEKLININKELTRYQALLDTYVKYEASANTELNDTRSYIMEYLHESTWKESVVKNYLASDEGKNDTLIRSKYATQSTILQNIKSYRLGQEKIQTRINRLEAEQEEYEEAQNFQRGRIEALDWVFNTKYARFIQEGSWLSEDYYDDNLYYLDGESVAYTSSRPQIQYSINVLRLSALEKYKSKIFNVGDICFIQDAEFFGYYQDRITPYKEKVTISEITSVFDSPEQDSITVQNYKTQFEDLFQRITAATQSLQYNEGGYARAAAVVTPTGEINPLTLEKSFAYNEELAWKATDDSVVINSMGITAVDMSNPQHMIRLSSYGLQISEDGGITWKTGVNGLGISTQTLTAGNINVEKIQILNGSYPTFQWNKNGLSAFKFTESGGYVTDYDASHFVRFDQYGIYGVSNINEANWSPTTESNPINYIFENASFGMIWDKFFMRNKGGDNSYYQKVNELNVDYYIKENDEYIKFIGNEYELDTIYYTLEGSEYVEAFKFDSNKFYYTYDNNNYIKYEGDTFPKNTQYYEFVFSQGYIEISTDKDIAVNDGQYDRIRIGRLGNIPSSQTYGMILRNGNGETTLETDSNGNLWLQNRLDIGTNTTNRVGIGNLKSSSYRYFRTEDETYQQGKTYYILNNNNEYEEFVPLDPGNPSFEPNITYYERGAQIFEVINANDTFIVYDDGSIKATAGSFSGELQAASGTFSGELQAATGTFRGDISAATGTFSGRISASEGLVGGFIIGENTLSSRTNNLILRGQEGYFKTEDTSYQEGKTYYTFNGTDYILFTGSQFETGVTYYEFDDRIINANNNFTVDKNGNVVVNNGIFNGEIQSRTGSIGGFTIGQHTISSDNLTLQSGYYEGETYHQSLIDVDNIKIGIGAEIKEFLRFIKSGSENSADAYIYNPSKSGGVFIQAGQNNALIIRDNGVIQVGGENGITINGPGSSIYGNRFSITPNEANFKNVTVRGTISASVFEIDKINSVGGAMLFKEATQITLEKKTIENVEQVCFVPETNIEWENGTRILLNTGTDTSKDTSSVDTNNKIYTQIIGTETIENVKYYIVKKEDFLVNNNIRDDLNNFTLAIHLADVGNQEGTFENDLIIGVNSNDRAMAMLEPRAITFAQYDEDAPNKATAPILLLGNLNNSVIEESNIDGYGLYGSRVFLKGSLTTKTSSNTATYAGVNTLSGVSFSGEQATILNDPSKIIFWAGAQDSSDLAIQSSPFQVTEEGSIYARKGLFEGMIISKSYIQASELYAVEIHGGANEVGGAAPLSIYDTDQGIIFKKSNDEGVLDIRSNGFYTTQFQEIDLFFETKDEAPNLNKHYYYKENNQYIEFTGETFEQGVTYYEIINPDKNVRYYYKDQETEKYIKLSDLTEFDINVKYYIVKELIKFIDIEDQTTINFKGNLFSTNYQSSNHYSLNVRNNFIALEFKPKEGDYQQAGFLSFTEDENTLNYKKTSIVTKENNIELTADTTILSNIVKYGEKMQYQPRDNGYDLFIY